MIRFKLHLPELWHLARHRTLRNKISFRNKSCLISSPGCQAVGVSACRCVKIQQMKKEISGPGGASGFAAPHLSVKSLHVCPRVGVASVQALQLCQHPLYMSGDDLVTFTMRLPPPSPSGQCRVSEWMAGSGGKDEEEDLR